MTRHLRHECGMAPKYQCPYCDKPSKFTQNIYAHIRKYHPGIDLGCVLRHKRFVCARCGRRYVNGKDLKRHEKYDCGRTPRFKCPYCEQRAKYRSIIYNHVRAIHPRMDVATMDLGSDVL
ncbi:hypothetical protein KM043_007664 [Ampulex compressa]|nr:hypothetical protein KM043_007664 [Ampulex compressa]